ncbi:hypothetical protein GCM10008018_53770 [Paenibacillus marchantiophytorum]|uniref:LPXTG cell wall anchor domain-containing protein n=1 Tax=Paenibacillus marchantiophytorum TaxID=1619310 RepID=A0ABQ1F5L6_9BACL|nr:hypothetical protein [Paenibacillus marchantiophytorum]GGA00696.1 hypothetical protein GCM10008018_53770 [Paenibacillus marchantiophytorum]
MKHWLLAGLTLVLAAFLILPTSALAYSYGDANTEDVAETYKLVQTSIGNGANDWGAAEGAYKERRAELVAHFGEKVGTTLDANFQAKDNKLVIANFKAVLVMNLERRFTYAGQGIDDYAGAKLLLAKAKATYDALEPYVGSGKEEINKAFDAALEALGNPGLFGVGKKPVQPDVFKEKVDLIYGKVKPLFPYKAFTSPAATSVPTPAAAQVETPKTEPAVKSESTPKQEQPAVEKEAKPTETKAPDVAAAVETQSPEPSASASPTPTAEAASPTPAATAAATAKPTDTASTAVKQAEPVKEASAHAPMQRTDRTNPLVSVAVIGGVIILLGGGVWFARKRKWM